MRCLSIILAVLFFAAAGCTRSAITVDDVKISKELFNVVLKERLESHKAVSSKINEKAVRNAVSDELISEALLVKEAKAKNIVVTGEEIEKNISVMRGSASEQDFREGLNKRGMRYDVLQERVRTGLLVSKLLSSLVKDDAVSEEEMKSTYAKSQVPFLKPEKDYVSILQVSGQSGARKAFKELKKGADFDTLAKDMSGSGESSSTNYGWLEPDALPTKELSTALKMTKINAYGGPIKGADGSYYFFRVKERQPAQVMPYEEAKPQIKGILLNEKRRAVAGNIVEVRKKTAKIKINTT